MFIPIKFYDAAVAEVSGGNAEPVVAEQPVKETIATETKNEAPKIEASKARKVNAGELTSTKKDSTVEKPIVNTEKKEEPKLPAQEQQKVETTAQTPEAETKANPEPQKQEVEKTLATSPQIVEAPKPTQSLQEVLKGQQPDNVLKELGFDDDKVKFISKLKDLDPKMVAFLNVWENKGDVEGYLKEMATDYSKMSPEDVMRHQLREEYPKATDQQLNALYKKKIVEAYNLDSEDEDLAAEGKMLLDAESDKFRDKFAARQQEKLLPKAPEPKAEVVDNSAAEAQQKETEAYKNKISSDQFYKDLTTSNEIILGKGEDKFKYPINSKELSDMMFDGDLWAKSLLKPAEDGSATFVPDVEKQILIAAVAKYGKDIFTKMSQHYKSLGGKAAIEPIENAKQTTTNYSVPDSTKGIQASKARMVNVGAD